MPNQTHPIAAILFAALLAAPAAAIAGTGQSADDGAGAATMQGQKGEPADSGTTVSKDRLERAWDDFASFTAEQKDAAVKAGKDVLDAMDERIDKWRNSDEAKNITVKKREEILADMREMRDRLAERLDKAKDSTRETWDDFRSAVGDAVDAFQKRYEDEPDAKKAETPGTDL